MSKQRTIYLALLLTCSVFFVACNDKMASSSKNTTQAMPSVDSDMVQDSGPVVAIVNGKPISQNTLTVYFNQRSQSKPLSGTSEELATLVNELVDMEIIRQAAEMKGIHKRPNVNAQVRLQRAGLLTRAYLQEFAQENQATEEEAKAFYDEQVKEQAKQEYKARHILLETEEAARETIKSLDEGSGFKQLAKDRSTGPSANKGGDLGWFPPNRMVKAFGDAVVALEKDSYTKDPVQTQFGWHVILLEDVRDTTPPDFEQSKQRIHSVLRAKKLEQYIEELRSAAIIDIKEMPGPAAGS